MGVDQHHDWRETAASALEWWCEAGVDTLTADLPRDWLSAEARPAVASPAVAAPAAAPEAMRPPLPDTLEAFLGWRMGDEAPEASWGEPRIAAAGPAAAGLMVVIDMPEAGDSESGFLMSGATGLLFDRMLAAIGRDRGSIHLAPLANARPPTGQLPREEEPRLAEIARHHLALAAPERVLVLGQAASRALLGTDGMKARNYFHRINHAGGVSALVVSYHPRLLLDRPALKAQAWKDLQMLIGGSL